MRISDLHLSATLKRNHVSKLKQIQGVVPAVIHYDNHDLPEGVSSELTTLVQKHGLSVIINEPPVATDSVRLVVRFPRRRELPHPVELRRVDSVVARNSFRGFGINE
jgi:hypothetical protein